MFNNYDYQVKGFWRGLPRWSKGFVAIGTLGIGFIIVRTLYKNYQTKVDLAKQNQAAIMAANEIRTLENQGLKQTYADSQYEVFSQVLVDAMNSCGTTEENIYNVFRQIKNDIDIRKLISIFGIRYYTPCAADQPISLVQWWFGKEFGGTLAEWLSYDLTTDELEEVNSILRSNSVNFTF